MLPFDATLIHPGLWQGSRPPFGNALRTAGFNMVVLCAEEFQPPHIIPLGYEALMDGHTTPFPGVEVVYAPNDDAGAPTRDQLHIAVRAANKVANNIRSGGQALVTCWMGMNRSGLVTALALHKLLGISGEQAVRQVKAKRKIALRNSHFCAALRRIP